MSVLYPSGEVAHWVVSWQVGSPVISHAFVDGLFCFPCHSSLCTHYCTEYYKQCFSVFAWVFCHWGEQGSTLVCYRVWNEEECGVSCKLCLRSIWCVFGPSPYLPPSWVQSVPSLRSGGGGELHHRCWLIVGFLYSVEVSVFFFNMQNEVQEGPTFSTDVTSNKLDVVVHWCRPLNSREVLMWWGVGRWLWVLGDVICDRGHATDNRSEWGTFLGESIIARGGLSRFQPVV